VLIAAGFTMPITASQILRVNMVTSVLLGALGADPRRQTIVA
jgi:hypothetical protein